MYYRSPRTTQEKRNNQENWHRAKRSPCNLPDLWDDIYAHKDNCWKSKRKKRYRPNKRGQMHSLIIPYYDFCNWQLEEYFKENNIPVKTEMISRTYLVHPKAPYWTAKGWTQKPRLHKRTLGIKFIWWSDKDIGMKYLLKQFKYAR